MYRKGLELMQQKFSVQNKFHLNQVYLRRANKLTNIFSNFILCKGNESFFFFLISLKPQLTSTSFVHLFYRFYSQKTNKVSVFQKMIKDTLIYIPKPFSCSDLMVMNFLEKFDCHQAAVYTLICNY